MLNIDLTKNRAITTLGGWMSVNIHGHTSLSINIFSYALQTGGLGFIFLDIMASLLGHIYYPTLYQNVSSFPHLDKIFKVTLKQIIKF